MIVALPWALSLILVVVGILVNNSRLVDVNAWMPDLNARLTREIAGEPNFAASRK